MKRRDFMRTAGGATAVTAATAGAAAPAVAQEDDGEENGDEEEDNGEEENGNGAAAGGEPDFGAYMNDAREFDTTADLRGQEEVTVEVGAGDEGLAYGPAGIWIDPGTNVVFEWTGDGGGHNVIPNEDVGEFGFDEIIADPGVHYEYTFTEEDAEASDGIVLYHCAPHEGQGMKGGIAIGEDVPTIDPAEAAPGVEIPDEALALTVATIIAMGATLGLGYFFMKYGGDDTVA